MSLANATWKSYHNVIHQTKPNLEQAWKQYVELTTPLNAFIQPHKRFHSADGLRIMTWNIHGEGFSKLIPVFDQLDADIIGLQEVAGYMRPLHGYYAAYCEPSAPTRTTSDKLRGSLLNMILVREGLSTADQYYSTDIVRNNYPQEGRCLAMIELQSSWGGMYVLNTHLDVYDYTGSTRRRQIQDIIKLVDRLPPGRPVLLMGDFNATLPSTIPGEHLKWLEQR